MPRNAATEEERAGQPALRNRRIIVLGLVAFALSTAEGAAYDWSDLHLRNVIGAAPNVAVTAGSSQDPHSSDSWPGSRLSESP